MKARFLILSLIPLTACSGLRGCSADRAQPLDRAFSNITPEPLPPSTPVATPDPLSGRRLHLAARIAKLTNSDCDKLVLLFQLVPRDEILEPLSEPKKDLLRYVRHARDDELADLERAIDERNRRSADERDAMQRAREDRRR